MPYAVGRQCVTPGCPNIVPRGSRCEDCRRDQYQARREREGTSSQKGYGVSWQRLRAHVLAGEPLCRHCAREGRVVVATEVDHIVPRAQGGSDALTNLQALCKSCHSRKTLSEGRVGQKVANPAHQNARRPHTRAREIKQIS